MRAGARVWFGTLRLCKAGAYTMLNLNRAAVSLSRVLQASAAGSVALLVLVAFVL